MNDLRLDRQCSVLTQYLIKQAPNDYIMGKYRQAHESGALKEVGVSCFDRTVAGVGSSCAMFAKLADVYSAVFFKNSLFRKKLILLIAILESTSPYSGYLDTVSGMDRPFLLAGMALRGILFPIQVVLSAIFFLPLRVICGVVQWTR